MTGVPDNLSLRDRRRSPRRSGSPEAPKARGALPRRAISRSERRPGIRLVQPDMYCSKRRAGMRAVAICTGHSAEELAGPHVVASIRNYHELIKSNFLGNLHAKQP